MEISIIVHEAEEGGYWAEVPALPGCATQGDSLQELLRHFAADCPAETWARLEQVLLAYHGPEEYRNLLYRQRLPPEESAFGTAAFGQLVAARGVSGPVKVESERLSQSTW